MKQTAMQELLDEVISEREKSISVEFREALDFVITAIKKDYKEIEKQQQGYSEEEVKQAYTEGSFAQLRYIDGLPYIDRDRWFEQFKNK